SAGPTGGAGFAWPPGIWSLISVKTFFAICFSRFCQPAGGAPTACPQNRSGRRLVDLLLLVEGKLDRNLALEDVDEHLELLLLGVDLDDLAVEVGQRAGGYLHGLTQ